MNKLLATLALCAATAAHADFSGPYAPASWTTTAAGDGMVQTSTSFIALTSPTTVAAGGFTRYTTTALAGGTVSFDWTFSTNDDPQYESFGYLLNGLYASLTTVSSPNQAGSNSFVVNAGDVFGFAAYAIDDLGGSATSYVFSFAAPVPEASTLAMWVLGGGMFAGLARRRQQQQRA